MYDVLICPICAAEIYLSDDRRSLYCKGARRHCFDIAASGYLPLAPNHSAGGDSKECVRSRTAFLNAGYYQQISDTLNELLLKYSGEGTVIDAGCGEGYYSNRIASLGGFKVYGFDLSRSAVDSAAKNAKRNNIENSLFSVAGIYSMPFADGAADAVVNIFAPCAEDEFCRVLKDGGFFYMVGAGEDHLFGFKKALYKNPYKNEKREDAPLKMKKIDTARLQYSIDLNSNYDIMNLFAMTPYFYRTSIEDKKKLESLSSLTTEVDVEISVYKKL